MAETIRLVDPNDIRQNPENPRLIFRQAELDALQQSIAEQGILVPLTVYSDGKHFTLLDGERRWRCARKLGLTRVPVILQPKPDRLTNLMMMFAIHHAREDWDPLPTAVKLQDMEAEFRRRHEREPTETELAGLASMSRGEVRRLKKLLGLPERYRQELLAEAEKPRSEQTLRVDQVLEATNAGVALRKREIIDGKGEEALRKALVDKFRNGVEKNTVAPRLLARLARAVDRDEVPMVTAKRVVASLIKDPEYTIDRAFKDSVEQVDFEHGVEQLAARLLERLEEHERRRYEASEGLVDTLARLMKRLRQFSRTH